MYEGEVQKNLWFIKYIATMSHICAMVRDIHGNIAHNIMYIISKEHDKMQI